MTRPARRTADLATAVLVAVVVTTLTFLPASSAPTWTDIKTLSGPSTQGARVVLDSSGNATAVWCSTEEVDSVVQSSYRPAGGPWSAAVDLGAGCFPELVVDPQGRTTAVWSVFEDPDSHLQWSSKLEGGGWGAAADLFADPHDVAQHALATDPAGNLTLFYLDPTATGSIVTTTIRPVGGDWSSPSDLSGDDTHGNPVVVAYGDGRVTAAWQEGDHVWATTRAIVGGVSTIPEDIGPGGSPSLGVDSAGSVTVAWESPGGVIATRRLPLGGAWTSVDTLNTGGSTSGAPVLAVAASGAAVVAWSSAAGISTEFIPYAAHRPAGSNDFGEPVPLDDPEQPTGGFDVAADGLDRFVVAWDEGTMISPNHVLAARLSGGTWSSAQTLTIPDQGFMPDVALNGSGDGVVAFEGNFADGRLVQAVGLDVAGPQLKRFRVPAKIPVGKQITLSAVAKDTWSTVAKYVWSFGDGVKKKGSKVIHTYAKRGHYDVRLTVTDAVGNKRRFVFGTDVVTPPPRIKGFSLTDQKIALGEKTVLNVRLNTKATVRLVVKGANHGVKAVILKKLPRGISTTTIATTIGGKTLVPDTYVITGTATNNKGTSAKKLAVLVVVRR